MPSETSEQDTILRNFRLIASPWNIFVFLINPFLGWGWMMGLCLHMKDIPLPPHLTFWLGFAGAMSAFILETCTSEIIKTRLREAGYVQKRTRTREVDLALNFAVCGAFLYYMLRWDDEKVDGGWEGWHVSYLVVVSGIDMNSTMCLMFLGPTLWFTVRAR